METTQWGWFNNAQPPVLHVESGDTIVFETMMHSHNQVVPGATIEQIKKLRTDFPGRGPHTLTGPVYIEGAEPGDVLKVRINRIVPRAYGTNFNVPGMFGQFPSKFPDGQVKYFYLDLDRKIAEFAPGIEIPLAPFPGTLGVARAEPGQYSSVPPGRYAGNLDIRDMTEGTALYVPVFVKGALLWTGDSHAAQGNGEINLTALETAYKEMNVTVEVIKNMSLEWPRVETKDAWITIGLDRDLNKALEILMGETSKFLTEQRKMSNEQASKQMMAAWDCRITPGRRRQQGHPLLQREERNGNAQDRALAREGKQGVPGDGRQGRRSQQGDGRRVVGDDRAPAERKEAEPPRRVQPRQHGDGLPSCCARRRAEGGALSRAEEHLGRVALGGARSRVHGCAAGRTSRRGGGGGPGGRRSASAAMRVVATTTDLAALAAAVGGDLVTVESIVPAGADPEAFEPRPGDLAKLRQRRARRARRPRLRLLAGYAGRQTGEKRLMRGGEAYLDASAGIPLLEIRGQSVVNEGRPCARRREPALLARSRERYHDHRGYRRSARPHRARATGHDRRQIVNDSSASSRRGARAGQLRSRPLPAPS